MITYRFVPIHLLLLAATLALSCVLAGCSEETPTAAPTPEPSPTATATATPLPLPTATAVPTETPEPEAPQAPEFSLPTGTGERYTLDDLLAERDALVIVFYRSYG